MSNYNAERFIEYTLGKCYGKYPGKVVNNNDPLNRGRLEVEVKSIFRDETCWAMPCLPMGGNGMGIFMIPENGTSVWVEFAGGDISHPIWTGCFWGDDESPKDNKTAEPKVRLIRSERGLTISLDDQDEVVTISDKEGRNSITIEVQTGRIKITGSSAVILDATNVQLGGQTAMQPVVKGLELYSYLIALAAAATPKSPAGIPPPPFSMLSQKVKTV